MASIKKRKNTVANYFRKAGFVMAELVETGEDGDEEGIDDELCKLSSLFTAAVPPKVSADDFVEADCNVQAVASLAYEDIVSAVAGTPDAQADRSTKIIANCFAHAGFSRSHAEDTNDDCKDGDDLYEAVNSIVGGDLEGNFESFAMADADVPVVAPATDAEIVDLLGGPDEEEEPLDEQPREIPTVAQTQEILHLLRNRVECAGGDHDLIICLKKLERALLAPSRSTRQSQLTDFFVRE
ncbi:hypothetical protein HPB52_023618 [Rhipicephalus sanguineus]|uniref:Uncharacterized protein n=1 Tax=Rhipicephalus sanguineus TaxID=34632 RepID=A0A9D4Q8U2_RHISA|nr:hypothetical protein HPB52_023618 [Rhipicephalus sanguineus]